MAAGTEVPTGTTGTASAWSPSYMVQVLSSSSTSWGMEQVAEDSEATSVSRVGSELCNSSFWQVARCR